MHRPCGGGSHRRFAVKPVNDSPGTAEFAELRYGWLVDNVLDAPSLDSSTVDHDHDHATLDADSARSASQPGCW